MDRRPPFIFPRAASDQVVFSHGKGPWLFTTQGEKVLDFGAGYAASSLGYGEHAATHRIADRATSLVHTSSCDFANPEYIDLATYFQRRMRSYLRSPAVYIGLSGADVVEAALKLVSLQRRDGVLVSFHGSFHGRTAGALSVGSSPSLGREKYARTSIDVRFVPYPETSQDLKPLLERLSALAREGRVVCVLAEPILGEGGYKIPPPGFLPLLRKYADDNDSILIFDEIQTGVGRTGQLFCFEHVGTVPDILLLGKGLGAGMPLGLMVFDETRLDASGWDHACTFAGNVLSCAAALATLEIVDDPSFLSDVNARGAVLLEGIRHLAQEFPYISAPRGKGLMAAFDLSSSAVAESFRSFALRNGLLLLPAGERSIRVSPPLTISEDALRVGLGKLERSLRDLHTVASEAAESVASSPILSQPGNFAPK